MQILKQSGQIETERFEYREIKWISSRGQQFFFLNINHLGMSSVTWHAWWWIFSARDFSVVLFTYCLYCTHFYLNHNYFPRCPCTEESLVYTWIFVVVFMLLYQSSVWMPLKKIEKGDRKWIWNNSAFAHELDPNHKVEEHRPDDYFHWSTLRILSNAARVQPSGPPLLYVPDVRVLDTQYDVVVGARAGVLT